MAIRRKVIFLLNKQLRSSTTNRLTENRLECLAQRRVDLAHAHLDAEIPKARHVQVRGGNSAGNDARKMGKFWCDIERYPVKGYPAPDPDADGRDLILGGLAGWPTRLIGAGNPDSNTVPPPLALDIELSQRRDDPLFQRANEGAQVGFSAVEIEHHIDHPLARSVIGE